MGIGFGAALAGARFGFTTGWRQLVEQRDPRGVYGQLLLLALAAALAMPLLGRFGELHAALGPPSVSLLIGAFVFGLTMQIADGCGSGTLYKAGLGVPRNMAILPLFALGSFLGSVQMHDWLTLGRLEPIGLVQTWGAGPALAATVVGLGTIALAVRLWVGPGKPLFEKRWVWGAVALALLASANLVIAGQPWGVVYGFGLWGAKGAQALGLFDPSHNSFWSDAGNARRLAESALLDVTSITNIGLLGGALWVSARKPAEAPVADRDPMGDRRDRRLRHGLQLTPGVRLQRGRDVQRHLHGERAWLDLDADGFPGHAGRPARAAPLRLW